MVLLFTHQNSQRVHYIFNEVLSVRLGITFQITNDWSFFQVTKAEIKIAYTDIQTLDTDFRDYLWVYNEGLLMEDFIRDFSMPISKRVYDLQNKSANSEFFSLPFEQIEALFLAPTHVNDHTNQPKDDILSKKFIPFDIFSEIFWCISRYEEYQWEKAISNGETPNINFDNNGQPLPKLIPEDAYGRYPAKQSLLFQNGWLETPIVDKLIWLFGHCINQTPLDQFEIIATADIDMALRYGGRTIITWFGSFLKDIFLRPNLILERFKTLVSQKDPYQMDLATLPILEVAKTRKLFILNHRVRTDKNKQISSKTLFREIKRIREQFSGGAENWGLHPSWQSQSNQSVTKKEWEWEKTELEKNINTPVKHARLHYIHLKLPGSYQILQEIGISHDWSMGYPDAIGFRAGTSKSYLWYDLSQEKYSGLNIHPFCIMDVTCKNYLGLTHNISIEKSHSIKQSLYLLGGTFCFIFHNESVSNSFPWKGWKNTIIQWVKQPISNPIKPQ
jgi:hypothetical protein